MASSGEGKPSLPEVVLYVDGGCQPNPGPGGYGAIVRCNGTEQEISGGFRRTTNNRMEILAVIAGLRSLAGRCRVAVNSDSQYVVNAMNRGWARRWRARNWHRTDTELAVNPDLWEELLALCERHQVSFAWVRGHAGNPLNERCDALATAARSAPNLPPDPGYGKDWVRTPQTPSGQVNSCGANAERCAPPRSDDSTVAAGPRPVESVAGRAVQLTLFDFP